ncbi:hypothetical protein [Catenulispora sp. GAS73]|uniref:hypothetical protein n=1 Tax=Catenulispora sp. GAS73 TaxID=3156269 RepID=UPI0035141958
MAVMIFGALPLVEVGRLWAFSSLAVSVLVVLLPRRSTSWFVALVAAPVPLAFHDARSGPYFVTSVALGAGPQAIVDRGSAASASVSRLPLAVEDGLRALLTAAGIEALVVAESSDLVDTVVDETLKATLRRGIGALLRNGNVSTCVVTVRSDVVKTALQIQTDRSARSPRRWPRVERDEG